MANAIQRSSGKKDIIVIELVMKAIILTFSKVNNRGANLQCYALMSYLKSRGYDVEFLDVKHTRTPISIKGRLYESINDRYADAFRRRNGFRFTRTYASYDDLCATPPQADIFIVGSDQVWNVELTRAYDPRTFFFTFLPEGVRRVAYAASFGNDYWVRSKYDDEIKEGLKLFSAVSVREESAVDICRRELGIENAEVVLDPTLLLERESVMSLMGRPAKHKRDHIFCYLLYKDAAIEDLIARISDELRLPVEGLRNGGWKSKLAGLYGIDRWLRNIYDANFVITNSFHCMVFCILLHKPFVVVPPYRRRQTRMLSLLGKLNLAERYTPDAAYLDDHMPMLREQIDYEAVERLLDVEREKSKRFIDKSLAD